MTYPVLSRDDHVWHQPDGLPRRYLLALLTRRERNLADSAVGIATALGALAAAAKTVLPDAPKEPPR